MVVNGKSYGKCIFQQFYGTGTLLASHLPVVYHKKLFTVYLSVQFLLLRGGGTKQHTCNYLAGDRPPFFTAIFCTLPFALGIIVLYSRYSKG